ncbi:sugar ABC transporter substrate-binding protein [Pantoea sp. S62]|uniref:sugar ABC transporter substrate-binding protein n=1 Tax=Pantoea sp. S62 TaxID=2769342 RepID=UPI001911B291|nr:sugar ABC transporter substrate-binding protein [Pantoea sp. S62]MBK5016761.1 sugar ABC transporter substrate-binding protein [Pantoea sp. S62]
MKMTKHLTTLALLCMLPASVLARDITIGVSMDHFDDNFQTILRQAMQKKMKALGDVNGQFEDAKGDSAQQLQQVESFIGQGADAIIVTPTDTQAMKPIIRLAENAKIPLVFVNRRPEAALAERMAYVGSDPRLAGKMQMEAMAKLMNNKGNIMILMGNLSGEDTRERTKGVEEVAAAHPGIKILDKQTALFFRKEANDVTTNWLLSGQDINAIVANNDEMAIGAILALKQAGQKDILVAGIDGTPDALQFVKQGELNVTIFQDAKGQGDGAVQSAIALVKGQKVEQNVLIPYQMITKDNYQDFAKRNVR